MCSNTSFENTNHSLESLKFVIQGSNNYKKWRWHLLVIIIIISYYYLLVSKYSYVSIWKNSGINAF